MSTVELPPTRIDLDRLISRALATGNETDRFDFKQELDLDDPCHVIRLVRAIGAFCNTDEGGFVLIGISDDRQVAGLSDELYAKFDQTRVHNLVSACLAPTPSLQVRQHVYEGKLVVVVEVPSFDQLPCVVSQSKRHGKERLEAGTFLRRDAAARSAVLTSESELRRLCDAIVRRRAGEVTELLRRGMREGFLPEPDSDSLAELRAHADVEWPSQAGGRPFVEVAFASQPSLRLAPSDLQSLIPGAAVEIEHGFPFHYVENIKVTGVARWGLYGRIPYSALGLNDESPSYLWLLSRSGAFLDRHFLWEDGVRSQNVPFVSLHHLLGRLSLLLRFLERYADTLQLPGRTRFRLSLAANNVAGRLLKRDTSGYGLDDFREVNTERRVEASTVLTLSELRARERDTATDILEEIVWQMGRDDLGRRDIEHALDHAKDNLGPKYQLK